MRIIIDGKFNAHEDLTGVDPLAIDVEESVLKEIQKTKCFDVENNCVIDYDNAEELKRQHLEELRINRKSKCFSIINRGQLWYETLSDEQKEELKLWYMDWLNVTETLVEPTKPEWME